jgi:trimethylamine monooxygenase
MQDQWLSLTMFDDAQAWYARDVILGRIEIPKDRQSDMDSWSSREATLKGDEANIRYQIMDYTAGARFEAPQIIPFLGLLS